MRKPRRFITIALLYKHEMDDGRRKIPKEQYQAVKQAYSELGSYQKVADHYGVSKRLIIFIVNPESLQKVKQRQKQNRAWLDYYSTKKRREYMQKYRAKKRKHNLITHRPV